MTKLDREGSSFPVSGEFTVLSRHLINTGVISSLGKRPNHLWRKKKNKNQTAPEARECDTAERGEEEKNRLKVRNKVIERKQRDVVTLKASSLADVFHLDLAKREVVEHLSLNRC